MSQLARCPLVSCRAPLVMSVTGTIGCPWCARKRAGICRRCPDKIRSRNPRALYCARCKKNVVLAQDRARAERKALTHAAWRARPGVQERLNREAREWRRANPPDALDRLYQRAQYAKHTKDPAWRAETRRKQREGYARRQARSLVAA